MRRNHVILISLLLLLLIGGGAVAFYLHLRSQAPPEFSELNRFLLKELPPSGWVGMQVGEYEGEIHVGPRWFDLLGIDRSKEAMVTQYIVVPEHDSVGVHLSVIHDGPRIASVYINPVSADHDARFRRLVLERYPRLEPIFTSAMGVP